MLAFSKKETDSGPLLLNYLNTQQKLSCYYKDEFILQCIQSRLQALKLASFSQYQKKIQSTQEIQLLMQALLVGVTCFFRDTPAFDHLKQWIKLRLQNCNQFKVWVPGCASGEEAYSIAMIIRECCNEIGRNVPVEIIASDINGDLLDKAQQGIFSTDIEKTINRERRAQYFQYKYGHYYVNAEIKKMVSFYEHNIVNKFSKRDFDLISCRNLLIYLKHEYQHLLIQYFYQSLRKEGCLFLGNTEFVLNIDKLFTVLSMQYKLFSK